MGTDRLRCLAGATLALLAMATPAPAQAPSGGPYVPTPHAIAERMLTLAGVGPGDHLIDLGSGDGRLVIAAVAKHKASGGLGVEIDADLVKQATDEAKRAGVADRVTFVAGDLLAADIGQATVLMLYLLPNIMGAVEAKLRSEARPGSRVVSHDYSLPGWEPVEVVAFDSPEKVGISGTTRTVLRLYRVPEARLTR